MLKHDFKFIAIIPARGGSKGIPKKNIALLNGKPLIYYTIKAAIDCPYISKCLVSTDCNNISNVSKNFGAEIIERPTNISHDHASTEAVIEHAISHIQENHAHTYIVLMQPTSPLRDKLYLTECIEKFIQSGCRSAVSVCLAEHHPFHMLKITDSCLEPIKHEYIKPRQLLPEFYRINGAIYITNISDFLKSKSIYNTPTMPYIMDQKYSIDIDTHFDLALSEFIMQREGMPC